MSTVSRNGLWLAAGLAIFTYLLGQQAGRSETQDEMTALMNDAFNQCQTQGSWLLCPSHIQAIASTRR